MLLSEFEELIEDLHNPDLVVHTLKVLITNPIKDKRLIPYLEQLTTNKTIVLIQIPYKYAEVRYLAINALAATYKSLNITNNIVFNNILKPLDTTEIVDIANKVNLKTKSGIDGAIKTIEQLREFDLLPTISLRIN